MISRRPLTLLLCILTLTILLSSHGYTKESNNTPPTQTNDTYVAEPKENTKETQEIAIQDQKQNQKIDPEVAKVLTSIGWNGAKTVSLIMLSELIGDIIHE